MIKVKSKTYLAAILAVFLLVCVAGSYLLGYRSTIVIHESMEPAIPKWSLVVLQTKNIKPEKYDIVQFRVEGKYTPVVHRIVEESENHFVTQGDANPITDSNELTVKDIDGVYVTHIPILGIIFFWIQQFNYLIIGSLILISVALGLSLMKKEKMIPNEAEV
ncbi:signal peptidase I [Cytobacillus gottheilii]|uniref:signal peptidase I n=1 Tax=Cytobacillus gottheilii TaxID=859144 RepID=UPI0009BA2A65|nr:signal peptidase I [Cytobacillus gottheilii]